MPSTRLTDVICRALPPGDHWDSLVPGFGLRVGKNRKTWLIRYRKGGRNPRVTVGHFPAMGLAEARAAAREAFARIDAGGVPQAPAPHPRSPDALTVDNLLDRYERARRREGKGTKTLIPKMKLLRKELGGHLDRPARDLTKADLRAIRDAIAEGRGAIQQSRAFLANLSPVLRWAAHEDLIEANICDAIRKPPPNFRSRTLTRDELARVWEAAGRLPGTGASFGRLVRFLLLTGLRRGEAASLRFGDILDGTLRLRDTKSSRPHALRLPPLALDIIGQGSANDLCFPTSTGGRLSGFAPFKTALDKAAGVEGWVLHDLRRTCATGLQELGVPPHVIEAVLNHSLRGVQAIYLRSELEQAKGEALAKWALEIARLTQSTMDASRILM